eukprot:104236-Pyramimonas_sp.AAC.1
MHARDLDGPKTRVHVPTRARLDAPSSVRRRNKAFGLLWARVADRLRENNGWRQGMKLGSQGIKGTLFMIENDECSILLQVEELERNQFDVKPELDNLAAVGIDKAKAESMAAAIVPR